MKPICQRHLLRTASRVSSTSILLEKSVPKTTTFEQAVCQEQREADCQMTRSSGRRKESRNFDDGNHIRGIRTQLLRVMSSWPHYGSSIPLQDIQEQHKVTCHNNSPFTSSTGKTGLYARSLNARYVKQHPRHQLNSTSLEMITSLTYHVLNRHNGRQRKHLVVIQYGR
jgi:hypothetical protein